MIRARVMTELLQGRNPLDLLKPRPRHTTHPDGNGSAGDGGDHARGQDGTHGDGTRADEAAARGGPGFRDPDDPGPQCPDDPEDLDDYDPGEPVPGYAGPDGAPAWDSNEAEHARYFEPDDPAERRGPLRPEQTAPPPANLNLTIPIGTLLGWSTTPAQAGSFGLLDAEETRAFVAAASRHPRTRWSITLIDPNGHAIAHGRARGQHPWEPPPHATTHATAPPETSPPDPDQAAQLGKLTRALKILFNPIAQETCDHRGAENRYTPSRKLKDLIRARTITCDTPGCNAQALYCDLDHTVAYPDGPSCQCNLGPKCRRHHRAKQAPGWRVGQPEPGIVRWTLPNGRTHTTTPTEYDS
jgi:hypothetical protein